MANIEDPQPQVTQALDTALVMLHDHLCTFTDPVERAKAVQALQEDVAQFSQAFAVMYRAAIMALREEGGHSNTAIARIMGMSLPRFHEMRRKAETDPPVTFT